MDLPTAMLLVLSLVYIYINSVDNMNSPVQGDLKKEQWGTSEQDIFQIISNANKELLMFEVHGEDSKVIHKNDTGLEVTRAAAAFV